MDEPIQYGVTDDYFDAVPMGDEIMVSMSDNVARTLAHLVDRLIRFLETGEVEERRATVFRHASSDKVLRRMFPDAYRDHTEAQAFRDRHAALLKDTEAPRRVLARCTEDLAHILPRAEVDDWLVTMALARFLVLPRKGKQLGMTGTWLNHVQECLVRVVNPRLARG
jgi:hypothetical protein